MKHCILVLFCISLALGQSLIPHKYEKGEITTKCDEFIAATKNRLDAIVSIPTEAKTFANTVAAMENVLADLDENTNPLVFMAYVSTNAELREEASIAEEKLSGFLVETSLRRDLYDAFNDYVKNNEEEIAKLGFEQKKLIEVSIREYRKSGLSLPEEKRNKLQELKKELSSLETQFSKNLVEFMGNRVVTEQELKGTPESFRSRLQKDADGNYIVTTKYPDYAALMRYAEDENVRKRMLTLFYNRAVPENTKLLEQAIAIRYEIAQILGYKNWADYRTDGRMAQNSENVRSFLKSLQKKLATINENDLKAMLEVKKKDFPEATSMNLWDIGYYSTKLKMDRYEIDDEVVREYFPVHRVIEGTFHIYSQLLGVEFKEVAGADTWHKDVKLFEIVDKQTKEIVAYFYADLYPREGKYGHAAAFTLRSGRKVGDVYVKPISSIVANLQPPTESGPSLLSHGDVETFFHEFGHIMHQTLTKVSFASLSGTSVSRDFVEAPSQMLENWVWNSDMLAIISGHYEDEEKKLPDEIKEKLLQIKHYNSGINYMRQVFYASIDMQLHSSGKEVDVNKVYDSLFAEMVAVEPAEGTQWLAGFGHLMGGYDAGYYGYLWSEVYAQDMFTKFAKNGLLDEKTGLEYRRIILEKGGLYEPLELVKQFLEREPDNEAFLKRLGLK